MLSVDDSRKDLQMNIWKHYYRSPKDLRTPSIKWQFKGPRWKVKAIKQNLQLSNWSTVANRIMDYVWDKDEWKITTSKNRDYDIDYSGDYTNCHWVGITKIGKNNHYVFVEINE